MFKNSICNAIRTKTTSEDIRSVSHCAGHFHCCKACKVSSVQLHIVLYMLLLTACVTMPCVYRATGIAGEGCGSKTQCLSPWPAAHLLLSTVASMTTAWVAGVKGHSANSSPVEPSSRRISAAAPLAMTRRRPVGTCVWTSVEHDVEPHELCSCCHSCSVLLQTVEASPNFRPCQFIGWCLAFMQGVPVLTSGGVLPHTGHSSTDACCCTAP
jgi:hypothetical protein